jgi:hypothetical protein
VTTIFVDGRQKIVTTSNFVLKKNEKQAGAELCQA